MRVAVALEGRFVSEHFGHCEGFGVYEISNDNRIVSSSEIPNPGHQPGFLPVFLKEKNVNVIIAGGMGGRAQELFAENGIQVVVGASGDKNEAVSKFLSGELVSTESVCTKHEHEGNCGN